MKKWRNYIPEGTNDILFKACSLKREIAENLRAGFLNCGFKEIETPTREFYDVFDFKDNGIPQENMYKYFDEKGRIVVLRPDFSIPICRVVSSKIEKMPVKVFYSGQVFKKSESLKGMDSEITQTGIEIIGDDSIKSDVEIIIRAIESIKRCGIEDFKIELGHSSLYKKIIENVNIDKDSKAKLKLIVENKNIGFLNDFLKENSGLLTENESKLIKVLPQMFGGVEVLDEIEPLVEGVLEKEIERLKEICEYVEILGYKKYLAIDLGMVADINYYTGIIIRAYASNIGAEILSGGRYDNVLNEFGKDYKAAGFALNINNILQLKLNDVDEGCKQKVIIQYNKSTFKKAMAFERDYISKKICVELSLFNTAEQTREYARENGFTEILILDGDKEDKEYI